MVTAWVAIFGESDASSSPGKVRRNSSSVLRSQRLVHQRQHHQRSHKIEEPTPDSPDRSVSLAASIWQFHHESLGARVHSTNPQSQGKMRRSPVLY